jgi:integrase
VLLGAHSDNTVARQDASTAEFLNWLARCGRGRTWADCTPDDVLVFMMTWWLPNHHARDGGEVGPSAAKACLSALSSFFTRSGRSGAYNAYTGQGNPCDAVWVEDFRAAYQRLWVQAGYTEVSAVPMTYAKYRALVTHLWGAVTPALSSLERVLLLRDLFCVLLLWQTAIRGHDVGKLGLGDFVDPVQPDRPYTGFPLPPPWQWGSAAAPTLGFRQRGTKTYKLTRAPLVLLEPHPVEPAFCIPRTMALYMWCCSQPDAQPGSVISDLLIRPLAPDRRGFKDSALRSAGLVARIRLHLRAAGLYDGETVHSFRRGALQAVEAAGGDDRSR